MYIEMYTLWFSCDCNIMRNALSKNLERKSSSLLPFFHDSTASGIYNPFLDSTPACPLGVSQSAGNPISGTHQSAPWLNTKTSGMSSQWSCNRKLKSKNIPVVSCYRKPSNRKFIHHRPKRGQKYAVVLNQLTAPGGPHLVCINHDNIVWPSPKSSWTGSKQKIDVPCK